MFYEVLIDEETRCLLEGQASGSISKGGEGELFFNPQEALHNIDGLMRSVARSLAGGAMQEFGELGFDAEVCFSIRADGNGTVMIAQDPSLGQFKVTLKRLAPEPMPEPLPELTRE